MSHDGLATFVPPQRDPRWNNERLSNEEITALGAALVRSLEDQVAARVIQDLRDGPHIDSEEHAELWEEFASAVEEIRVFGTLLYDAQAAYLRAHLCPIRANAAA